MAGRPTSCCRIGCRRCLSISLTVWNTCFLSLNQSIKGTEGHHQFPQIAPVSPLVGGTIDTHVADAFVVVTGTGRMRTGDIEEHAARSALLGKLPTWAVRSGHT